MAKKIDCGGPSAKFCRERQFPPSKCQPGSFRTKALAKGRKGVFCRPKGQKTLRLQSLLRPMRAPKCKVCRAR